MGTKQSFRGIRRQRITEKTICKVANRDDGANIKKPKHEASMGSLKNRS